jgi:hypothetical protein
MDPTSYILFFIELIAFLFSLSEFGLVFWFFVVVVVVVVVKQ